VKSNDGQHSWGRGHFEQTDCAGSNAPHHVFAAQSVLVSGSLRVSGGRLKRNIRLILDDQIHGASFKKRAPRAIKEIRDFATKAMVGCYPVAIGRMRSLRLLLVASHAVRIEALTYPRAPRTSA
jgi:hypothetical protein